MRFAGGNAVTSEEQQWVGECVCIFWRLGPSKKSPKTNDAHFEGCITLNWDKANLNRPGRWSVMDQSEKKAGPVVSGFQTGQNGNNTKNKNKILIFADVS